MSMNTVKPTSWRELEIHVIRWAEARKIIPNSTPIAQARKAHEEAGELLEALAEWNAWESMAKHYPLACDNPAFMEQRHAAWKKVIDAIGDIEVCMINVCALLDVDIVQCLGAAYDEIKDRKGTLLPSGVFLKEL